MHLGTHCRREKGHVVNDMVPSAGYRHAQWSVRVDTRLPIVWVLVAI